MTKTLAKGIEMYGPEDPQDEMVLGEDQEWIYPQLAKGL